MNIDTPHNPGPWEPDIDLANAETDATVEEFLADLAVAESNIREVERRLDSPEQTSAARMRTGWRQRGGYLTETTDLTHRADADDIDLSRTEPVSDEDALNHWPGV